MAGKPYNHFVTNVMGASLVAFMLLTPENPIKWKAAEHSLGNVATNYGANTMNSLAQVNAGCSVWVNVLMLQQCELKWQPK